MALTRSFRDTVAARAQNDPAFRLALFEENIMATFNPGDVVAQPDGPPMTVDRVEDDYVHCVWFVGTTLVRDRFRGTRLRKVC